MSDVHNQKQLRPKYSVIGRLIGVLMLVGIALGNVFLFSQAYSVNWQWIILALGGIILFSLTVWLFAKVPCLEFSPRKTTALRLLLFVIVMLISTAIFY